MTDNTNHVVTWKTFIATLWLDKETLQLASYRVDKCGLASFYVSVANKVI